MAFVKITQKYNPDSSADYVLLNTDHIVEVHGHVGMGDVEIRLSNGNSFLCRPDDVIWFVDMIERTQRKDFQRRDEED